MNPLMFPTIRNLFIYLTHINESGIGKTSFIDIIDMKDGKADTILDSTKTVLQKLDIDLDKIVGLGTDGAAVMTGCKGGVGVLLKECWCIFFSADSLLCT